MITQEQTERLSRVAEQTLAAFQTISGAARERLSRGSTQPGGALAVQNSFTYAAALGRLDEIDRSEREACERLAREPAVARVVVAPEEGAQETIYVARAASPTGGGLRVASYRSPLGRLASLEPGDFLYVPRNGGTVALEVVERALLRPEQVSSGWDAPNTVFESEAFGPVTVESLRRLLEGASGMQDVLDEVERLLREEQSAVEIVMGRRRGIIEKMGLRDQPILDRLQDEIFRLPLDTRLGVFGAPGSGKTTTLIRRLGQKLDAEGLQPAESALIERSAIPRAEPHQRSWLMFTPTDLLRSYVKEAFAREGVPAPDSRIRTWTTHRRELARSAFPILRSGTSGGTWVMREEEPSLKQHALSSLITWFEDFDEWQGERFWGDLSAAADVVGASDDPRVRRVADRIAGTLQRTGDPARRLLGLVDLLPDVRTLLDELRTSVAAGLRSALNTQLVADRSFLDQLATFLDTLGDAAEDGDEADPDVDGDVEDEEEDAPPQTRRGVAIATFYAALRRQARGHVSGRRGGRGRSAAVLDWLGARGLEEDARGTVGRSLVVQGALRRFASPVAGYVNGVSRRYRAFRRLRRTEGAWYTELATGRNVSPLEIDLILLATLRAANPLLVDQRVRRELDAPPFTTLAQVAGLHRNQILVDEVTDFSPVQLACMRELANPVIGSFFVCGDYNQRITSWGLRSRDELSWVAGDMDVRDVVVAYRQSRQLYDFSRLLAHASGGVATEAALPRNVENEGVMPALGTGLATRSEVVDWLAHRIIEIEAALRPRGLPSTAVLVHDEALVQPMAEALDVALEEYNLRAVACVNGQVIGQETDVRVFDVQHVKGMEFEAVFFLDVDVLSEEEPELFDKYLYVGATRAATYLGITCSDALPSRLAPLAERFCESWA